MTIFVSRKISIEEIKSRLRQVHGDTVTIDESSYISANKRARFIDKTYGVWHAQVKSVCNGRRHTGHKHVNWKRSLLTPEEIEQKLTLHHGDNVTLSPGQCYVNSHVKMRFLDKDHGEFVAMPYTVLNGYSGHPARGRLNGIAASRFCTVVKHWKSGEDIHCVGGYELAVVNWLNTNQIDFRWQLAFQTPQGRTYYVDLYVLDGTFADTYIEIKGTFERKGGHVGKEKWEWFHEKYKNSELWNRERLVELGILSAPRRRHKSVQEIDTQSKK